MFLLETKFGDLVKAFRTFGVAFFWQFVETAFFCPWQCSKSSVSLLSGKSVEIALFVSIPKLKISIYFLTKIYRPILIFDCGQKMFGLLPKKFRQGGQNFIPLARRNVRGSDVFDRNLSLYHFWSLSGKKFDVCQKFFLKSVDFFRKGFFLFLKILNIIVGIWTTICALSRQKVRRSFKIPYNISNLFLEG